MYMAKIKYYPIKDKVIILPNLELDREPYDEGYSYNIFFGFGFERSYDKYFYIEFTVNYKFIEENELYLPIFNSEEDIKYLSKRLLIERLNKQVTNHYNEIELIKDLFSKIGSVADYHNNKPFTKENDREIIIY